MMAWKRDRISGAARALLASAWVASPALGAEATQVVPPAFPQPRNAPHQITTAVEEQVVDAFVANRCDLATSLVRPNEYGQVRPLVLAVIAYCAPAGQDPEALFQEAEKRSPSSDTIVVLHARYRWKKDPESSLELWQRVLFLARSAATRAMAREYLEGTAEGDEEISIGRSLTYFVSAQSGASYETNPLGSSTQGQDNSPGSYAQNTQVVLGLLRGTERGSVAANLNLSYNDYFSVHEADLLETDLDFPLAFKAGPNEDVVFRPFGSYLTLGSSPFQALAGIGVMGVAYRKSYKQFVQGSVFQDRYFQSDVVSQQGTHFRFDYNWELYPGAHFVRFATYFEHVSASEDTDPTGVQLIPYSHNEMGAQAFLDLNFKWCVLSLYPRFMFRLDDEPSVYYPPTYDPSSGLPAPPPISKTRYDYQVAIHPAVTFPLAGYLQLTAWYEWSRTYSNITSDDYLDRRFIDQTVGIALKGFIANNY